MRSHLSLLTSLSKESGGMTHMERILLTLLPQYTHPSPMEEFFLEQEGRNLRFTSLLSRLIYDRLNR
jgi:hypothetical protein